ncbi:hypothetical protein PR048_029183 [Dryococelus australis]|uniref:Uncharacterized protein n=1 Tax=Dryococelus australis TaxID=614101 RepID=A0ABQ9GCM3_9NEOP|nr:hypothetical protein PR048_029183 [Dryococelus australis]
MANPRRRDPQQGREYFSEGLVAGQSVPTMGVCTPPHPLHQSPIDGDPEGQRRPSSLIKGGAAHAKCSVARRPHRSRPGVSPSLAQRASPATPSTPPARMAPQESAPPLAAAQLPLDAKDPPPPALGRIAEDPGGDDRSRARDRPRRTPAASKPRPDNAKSPPPAPPPPLLLLEGVEQKLIDFDDVLPHMGEFGLYQKILFVLLAPFAFFVTFTYFTQIFVTLVPDEHWCRVPQLANLTLDQR